MWAKRRKHYNDSQKEQTKIKKEIEDGTYVHPQHLTLQGITINDIKRKVGATETWQEKMDRESEEMFKNEERYNDLIKERNFLYKEIEAKRPKLGSSKTSPEYIHWKRLVDQRDEIDKKLGRN